MDDDGGGSPARETAAIPPVALSLRVVLRAQNDREG